MFGMSKKPRVVIVGGGFAGLNAAQQLKASRYDVTVVDPSPHIEWQPNIHEIISGAKKGDELRLNRAILVRRLGHNFVMQQAQSLTSQFVDLANGQRIPFDVCIVATGNVNSTLGIAGADQHVLPTKTVEQCQMVARRLHRASLSHRTCRVTVVGGDVDGVEAFGEVLRAYRYRPQFEFTVVDSAGRLLSNCPGNLDGAIRDHTQGLRVEYELGKQVEEVDGEGICFTDGSALQSDITLWSGAAAPNPFLAQAHLVDAPGQWAAVNSTFQSQQRENVFIIGDAARPLGSGASQQFQAVDMGKAAAQNVERLLAGKSLRDFSPSSKPQVVTFGDLDTFMVFKDFALSSGVLGVAKEAIYTLGLWQMAPPKNGKDLLHTLDLLQKSVRRVYLPTANPFALWNKLPKSRLLS